MPSSEVALSMVSSQLQNEAQFSSSTLVESDVLIDPPMLKIDDHSSAKKQKIFDAEKIIMGEELSDVETNYAQNLLKEKHPNVSGLCTILYKERDCGQCSDCTLLNKTPTDNCFYH